MQLIARLLTALVGLAHVGFMILEMFLWNTPTGQRIFALTPEQSAATAVLAANQGLYNGLIAAGLFWAAASGRRDLSVFFLVCVIMAGLFGGLTAKPTIVLFQAAPAFVALLAVLAAKSRTED